MDCSAQTTTEGNKSLCHWPPGYLIAFKTPRRPPTLCLSASICTLSVTSLTIVQNHSITKMNSLWNPAVAQGKVGRVHWIWTSYSFADHYQLKYKCLLANVKSVNI